MPKRRNAPVARGSSSDGRQETKVGRLTHDLNEALERQAATAEILRIISSSPTGVQPVFDAIVRNFVSLCGSGFGAIFTFDGELVHFAGSYGFSPEQLQAIRTKYPLRVDDRSVLSSRAILAKARLHIQDIKSDPDYDRAHAAAVLIGRLLAVPLLRDGAPLGVIVAGWAEPGATPKQHEDLLKVFADQAVIAIENARLLNELRQRTDDLTESLEQQTATSEILDVISNSPTDSQPAFDAIVRSALKLFPEAAIVIGLPDGDLVRAAAIADADAAGAEALRSRMPLPLTHEFITSTALLDRREIDLPDAREAPAELAAGARNFLASGYRAMTVMPMMRGESAIGTVNVIRRRPGPLSDKQRELLRIFANQAVIAIENTRLFNELHQRTDELTECLQQQTATSEVLKVISRSAFD